MSMVVWRQCARAIGSSHHSVEEALGLWVVLLLQQAPAGQQALSIRQIHMRLWRSDH